MVTVLGMQHIFSETVPDFASSLWLLMFFVHKLILTILVLQMLGLFHAGALILNRINRESGYYNGLLSELSMVDFH